MGFLRKILKKYLLFPILFLLICKRLSKFHVLDSRATLDYLLDNNCSCVRFGDGEFSILLNKNAPGFQRATEALVDQLKRVISTRRQDLLICVPAVLLGSDLSVYTSRAKYRFRNFAVMFYKYLQDVLSINALYGDSQISRPYMDTQNKEFASEIFAKYKKLFFGKRLIIIEGDKTRFGVGNDLLQEANEIKRILCPSVDAFVCYPQILAAARDIISEFSKEERQEVLFLIALGPTAKPLVLDLTLEGYRAIDVGHLDVEYEWFIRGATSKIMIPGKYVNEAKDLEKWKESPNLDLVLYNREIVAYIKS